MLTPAQLVTLDAYIDTQPDLASKPQNSDGADGIATLLNLVASPQVTVWKTTVSIAEIMSNGFVWTEVDALTVAKARIWDWMRQMLHLNAAKPNVRQGLRDCFGVGSGTYVGILPHCKRAATRAEALFSNVNLPTTGTPDVPATMTFEGEITYQDVLDARAL